MKRRILNWGLSRYRNYKRSLHDGSPENLQKSLKSLLAKSKYLFLITHHDSPHSNSRYVQPVVEWDEHTFKVWIGTSAKSRKVQEIKGNSSVTLSRGQDNHGANLVIYGKATLHDSDELRKKYWRPEWAMFFPGGPTCDDAVLICVEPERLELMDFKHNIFPEPFGLESMKMQVVGKRWLVSV